MSIVARVEEALRSRGYRLTPQRRKVVEALVELQDRHLSADDLYFYLQRKHHPIALATIYRTLALLEKLNMVGKITARDGTVKYEITPAGVEDRSHFICIKCGKIVELTNCHNDHCDCKLQAEQELNLKVMEKRVTLYGLCPNCQQG